MDKVIACMLDSLSLLPPSMCALVCRGEQWRIEGCTHVFGIILQNSPNCHTNPEGEDHAPDCVGMAFPDILSRDGQARSAERVLASKAGEKTTVCLGAKKWNLVWKWLAPEGRPHEEGNRLRIVLLHDAREANCLTQLYLLDQELHAIMDSMHDGLWIIDGQGITRHVNQALKRIADINPEEMIGKPVATPLHEGKFSAAVTLEALEKKTRVTRFDDYPNGTRCLNTSTPIFDKKGNIWRVVACIRDMTELEHLQKRLADAEREAYLCRTNAQDAPPNDTKKLIAVSEAMRRCTLELERAAKAPSGILISGETGTGKTFAASYIHAKSPCADGPFVSVNCAAIPATLIESELFGYDKGAFTGARQTGKKGYFELADKGTLLLDEIGDLPLKMQTKLLHVLDSQSFHKVGGEKEVKVDIRIIAATNKPLDQLVSSGKFRADLYYRLRVLSIVMPPLREHPADIPALMMFFLNTACLRHGGGAKTFSPRVVEFFSRHSWPGNVRELRAAVEFLAVMTESSVITMRDLPAYLLGGIPEKESAALPEPECSEEPLSFRDAVENLERALLSEALTTTGSTYKAAAKLGISQSTVVRKAKQLRIPVTEKKSGAAQH